MPPTTAPSFDITSIGVPGVLAFLIIKEVFSFVKSRSNGNHGHNGIGGAQPQWWTVQELKSAINDVRILIEVQNSILTDIHEYIKKSSK